MRGAVGSPLSVCALHILERHLAPRPHHPRYERSAIQNRIEHERTKCGPTHTQEQRLLERHVDNAITILDSRLSSTSLQHGSHTTPQSRHDPMKDTSDVGKYFCSYRGRCHLPEEPPNPKHKQALDKPLEHAAYKRHIPDNRVWELNERPEPRHPRCDCFHDKVLLLLLD